MYNNYKYKKGTTVGKQRFTQRIKIYGVYQNLKRKSCAVTKEVALNRNVQSIQRNMQYGI